METTLKLTFDFNSTGELNETFFISKDRADKLIDIAHEMYEQAEDKQGVFKNIFLSNHDDQEKMWLIYSVGMIMGRVFGKREGQMDAMISFARFLEKHED